MKKFSNIKVILILSMFLEFSILLTSGCKAPSVLSQSSTSSSTQTYVSVSKIEQVYMYLAFKPNIGIILRHRNGKEVIIKNDYSHNIQIEGNYLISIWAKEGSENEWKETGEIHYIFPDGTAKIKKILSFYGRGVLMDENDKDSPILYTF